MLTTKKALAVRELVHNATNTLGAHLQRTHVRHLDWISEIVGCPVYAKLEFQQPTGSFKVRGAINAVHNVENNIIVAAASAGNHGLAVAYAANMLGRNFRICLPNTASSLKREKLIRYGAQIFYHGDSLDDAISFSKELADAQGWDFISPFDDPRVIAGAATALVEGFSQIPEIETVVVPTGGGGLLSGCIWAEEYLNKRFNLIGVEPSSHSSFGVHKSKIAPAPTIADGLAVIPLEDSITNKIISLRRPDILTLENEQLAAGTLMIMNQESWLVEPSGAASISALIEYSKHTALTGPVLLLLTGGNISKPSLARLLTAEINDPILAELSGNQVTHVRRTRFQKNIVYTSFSADQHCMTSGDTNPNSGSEVNKCLMGNLEHKLKSSRKEIQELREYSSMHNLVIPQEALILAENLAERVEEIKNDLWSNFDKSENSYSVELNVRALNSIISALRVAFDWRSPSYDQSQVAQFYRLASQDSALVNYERYGHSAVLKIEEQMREVMGATSPVLSCTVTSSGMAAYNVIEAYLVRHKLVAVGSKIALAPYIYFEASEQICSIPQAAVHRLDVYHAEQVADKVVNERYDALFIDPLTNTLEMRGTNIFRLLELLESNLKHNITVIIDGTMVPACVSSEIFSEKYLNSNRINIIYYESASKYLQLGIEHCLAGVILHHASLKPFFEKYRRNLGATLYPYAAYGFPKYDRNFFLAHIMKLSDTALHLATAFVEAEEISNYLQVVYPGLPSHQDHQELSNYMYLGSCICFKFHAVSRNSSDFLNAFIEIVIRYCERCHVPITKGVSFGFNISRISAAAALAESEWPFLRLYVGKLNNKEFLTILDSFKVGCNKLIKNGILEQLNA